MKVHQALVEVARADTKVGGAIMLEAATLLKEVMVEISGFERDHAQL